jgi:hypothetical protein
MTHSTQFWTALVVLVTLAVFVVRAIRAERKHRRARDKTKLINDIVDDLRGSSTGLHSMLESHDAEWLEDDDELLTAIDDSIFLCSMCDWWCEMSEMSEHPDHDYECTDCAPNEE